MKTLRTAASGALSLALAITPWLTRPIYGQDPLPLPASAGTAEIPRMTVQTAAEGFVMFNGHMYRVTNGQAIRLAEEKILRVSSTGMTDFNGQPINLPAGSMLTLDGRVVPTPSGIRFTDGSSATTDETPPPTTPANAGAANERASMPPLGGNPGYPDRGVTGENLSGLAPAANASAGGTASSQTTVTRTRTTTGAASSNTGRSSGRDSAGGGTTDPTTGVILGPGTGLGTGIPVEGNVISPNPAGSSNTDPNAGNFNTRTTNPSAVPAKGPTASQPATTTRTNTNTGNSATDLNKGTPASGQSTNPNLNPNIKPSTGTGTSTSTGAGTTSGSGTSTNTNTGTSGR